MSVQEDVEKIIPGAYSLGISSVVQRASKCQLVLGLSAILLFFVALSLTIVAVTRPHAQEFTQDTCYDQLCLEGSAAVLAGMKKDVDPCENFYQYACGRWTKYHPIQPTDVENTVYQEVYRRNEERIRQIIETEPARTEDKSYDRKLKSFFKSCINDFESHANGGEKLIQKIMQTNVKWYVFGDIASNYDLTKATKDVHVTYWTDVFFHFYVGTDYVEPENQVLKIDLGGLGMYWWYYLEDYTKPQVDAYKKFMRKIAELLIRDAPKAGVTVPSDAAARIDTFVADVMTVETKLANITAYTLPTEDPHANENRVTLTELSSSASMLNWLEFFREMFPNIDSTYKVVLLEKEYLHKVSDMINGLGANKNRMLNNYLVWRLSQHLAQDLSWDYVHANREFYIALTGRSEFLGTWEYCFRLANQEMPEALGAIFVRDHFSDHAKKTAHSIVNYLKDAMRKRIQSLNWMEGKSKEAAQKKLRATQDKLGYPEWLGDTSKVDDFYAEWDVPSDKDFFTNLLALFKFQQSKIRKLLSAKEDQSEWLVNVYDTHGQFYQYWNELIFPAGMLQWPYYNSKMPAWLNYGAIGTLMGHELVHGFDEYGGFFTETGEILDWWTNGTTHNYFNRRDCVVQAYNKTVGPYIVPGLTGKQFVRVNSARYAYEGIAVEGGVRLAYMSYMARSASEGKELNPPGLNKTAEQSFFIAFAQTNCFNRRDKASYDRAQWGDVPEDLKVNGALSQMKEFQDAFQCPAKSPMNNPNKCNIF